MNRIHDHAARLRTRADGDLASMISQLRQDRGQGHTVLAFEVLVPCFAAVLEAVRRTTGMTYFDVQLLAGLALVTGAVAEMKTGEGKTIVAALPACLHGLRGTGVHVATVNAYLAERDYTLMAPAFRLLGFSTGLLREGGPASDKQAAYASDIVYGTGYEFGFDYLRDQAALRQAGKPLLGERFRNGLRGSFASSRRLQKGHAFAVIDEIDSVLIDEANTPLILSGTRGTAIAAAVYRRAADVAAQLEEGRDFVLDRRQRSAVLTDTGQLKLFQDISGVPPRGLMRPWSVYIEQALQSRMVLCRDVDYVVQDNRIRIVDQYTGRIFADRTWRDGLHQAVEQKEGVPITAEQQPLARISRQRYFGMYHQLCGMTGTAAGHGREFYEFYRLPVVLIPLRRPCRRTVLPTRYFATSSAKWDAIASDIQARAHHGQPVLVGTRTIQESQHLSTRLREAGIRHNLLNGKQTREEAEIVAEAGRKGTVTIATNMAGRGTDIHVDEATCRLGGLHVLATQRQESRRVDRQLIGRTARQGQPGSCQFFVSAEDEIITRYGGDLLARFQRALADGDAQALGRLLDRIQRRAERHKHEQRRQLYHEDRWLNELLTSMGEKDRETEDPCPSLNPCIT